MFGFFKSKIKSKTKSKTTEDKIKANSQYKYILKIVGTTTFKTPDEIRKLGGKDERRRYTIAKEFLELSKLDKDGIKNLSTFCSKHGELTKAIDNTNNSGIEGTKLVGYMREYIKPKVKL